MVIPQKVDSSSSEAFGHLSDYQKNLPPYHPQKWGLLEPKCIEQMAMVYSSHPSLGHFKRGRGRGQDGNNLMRERKKARGKCSDLLDPSHRGTKATPGTCQKAEPIALTGARSLRPWDREDLNCLPRFLVRLCHRTGMWAIWKERAVLLQRRKWTFCSAWRA